jgi:hypothetical protein
MVVQEMCSTTSHKLVGIGHVNLQPMNHMHFLSFNIMQRKISNDVFIKCMC